MIPLADLAIDTRLVVALLQHRFDDGKHIRFGDPAMQDQRKTDGAGHDQRLLAAGTEAAHRAQLDGKRASLDLFFEAAIEQIGTAADPACPHPDGDGRLSRIEALLPRTVQVVQYSDHSSPPCCSERTSSRSWSSRTFEWMTSSMAMTGANAHWPKQATVLTVNR